MRRPNIKSFPALATVAILTMKNICPQRQFRLSLWLHLFLLAFVSLSLFHSLTYATIKEIMARMSHVKA